LSFACRHVFVHVPAGTVAAVGRLKACPTGPQSAQSVPDAQMFV
jgi:hypothetical protein